MEESGFVSVHYDTERLWDVVCGLNKTPDFRVYDDIEVFSDFPAPLYLDELMGAYPDAKVVLTIRDTESWWESISGRYGTHPIRSIGLFGRITMNLNFKTWPRQRYDRSRMFKLASRKMAYGSVVPKELNYKARYEHHNNQVMSKVSPEKLLVMDICAGDGWENLCPFVGCEVPEQDFPLEAALMGG